MRILISSGEVSGDLVAGRVAREIRERLPGCEIYGLGGRHMADAGVELVASTTHLGCVGVSEAASVTPELVRCWRLLKARIRRDPPDVALLVGNDVFHILMARRLRQFGIPAVSLFPPQVWVWRSLAGFIARSYDLILASFPEEEQVYTAAGGNVSFVGHYLVDSLSPVTPEQRTAARAAVGLSTAGRIVGLLPGSRAHEIRRMGPSFFDAAARLAACDRDLRFVLPVADARFQPAIEREVHERGLERLIRLSDHSLTAMRAADMLIVSSGTATLEAALLQVPMVIAYRLSAVSHAIGRGCIRAGLIHDDVIGAPNLVLGRVVVPELLQKALTGSALADEAWAVLSCADRQREQRAACAEAAARLSGGSTLQRVADAVLTRAGARAIVERGPSLPLQREPHRRGSRVGDPGLNANTSQ